MKLASFYLDEEPNTNGVTLADIMSYNNIQMERVHNYIQWLFPNMEPSGFHESPEITEFDIRSIRARGKPAMLAALAKFRQFLASADWCHVGNHNLLRITRIIRSLRLFGLETEAREFAESCLEQGQHLDTVTLMYWRRSLEVDPKLSMRNNWFADQG